MQNPGRFVVGLAALAALVLLVAAPRSRSATAGEPVEPFWEPWSQERADKALAEGHPVLVMFTAEWCQSCLANEKMFVFTEEVRAAAKKLSAVVLRADFTTKDPAIVAELKKYGRAGVPVYVVLSPRPGRKPIVLPTVITTQLLLDGLAAAAAPTPPYRVVPSDPSRGTIAGTIRLARAIPAPKIRRPKRCDRERNISRMERSADLVSFDPERLTLGGCFVSLRNIAGGKDWPDAMRPERRTVTVTARDGLFAPQVRWVRTGTGVALANEMSGTTVNAKAYVSETSRMSKAMLQFNVMLSGPAFLPASDDSILARPLLYTLTCDCNCLRHMHAQILAFDHPYVDGPTALDGHYRLDDVPPGDYEVVCWHGPFTVEESEGAFTYDYGPVVESSQNVSVPANGTVTLDFVVDPPR